MSEVRKHMIFHGRVQGVGFRYTAKYLARSMNLTAGVIILSVVVMITCIIIFKRKKML